jgi:alpha-D-ribose 1-methylphosphonate 5-triphosphate synthase subunit PhnH
MMDDLSTKHQKNYRRLLDAMSRPGRVVRMEANGDGSPHAAALAIGQCLLDHEVSLCAIGNDSATTLQSALVKDTQVRIEVPEKADFLFIAGGQSQGYAIQAKRGSLEYPEEGATLVYCLAAEPVVASERLRVRLTGPGIAGPKGMIPEMAGIPLAEFEELMAVNTDYPLGVDAFFVRPKGELMALPRSTRIQVR